MIETIPSLLGGPWQAGAGGFVFARNTTPIGFHVFAVLVILMISGTFLDLILIRKFQ